jgi:ParB-like nuclease domain
MPENSGCTPGGEFKATDVRMQALSVSQIKLDGRNSRTHSAKQIRQIAKSIIAFGFTNPLLVNENAKLIAGEGRLKAAQLLGFAKSAGHRAGRTFAGETARPRVGGMGVRARTCGITAA